MSAPRLLCPMYDLIFVRSARIELASRPWQGRILPLNHDRTHTVCVIYQVSRLFHQLLHVLVPGGRIELPTPSSSGKRSTNELPRQEYFTL